MVFGTGCERSGVTKSDSPPRMVFVVRAEVLASGDPTRYRASEPPNSRGRRRSAE